MLSFLFSLVLSVSFAQQKTKVESFFPQGPVKSVSQVRIRFPKPMVKLGELTVQAPAQSDCFKNGSGRWLDTQNWVFDFNEELAGGMKCQVNVQGEKFEFNTGGTSIKSSFPPSYRQVQTDQNFVLVLDSKVDEKSVEKYAYFSVEGLGDRLPVQVVTGSAKKKIIKAAAEEFKYDNESFKGEMVVIKSPRKFPVGGAVNLVWPKSILSATGLSSPSDQSFDFRVREAFAASFSCDREAPGKPCIPLGDFRLSMTEPIYVKQAKEIFIVMPDGKKISPSNLKDENQDDKTSYVTFSGPFPPLSEIKMILPANVKSEDGNALTNQKQFPLSVKTADYPSLLKFSADFGIIEALPDAALAVTMRYVEKSVQTRFEGIHQKLGPRQFNLIIDRLRQVDMDPVGVKPLPILPGVASKKIQIVKPGASKETEVVGIPLKEKGFYLVEMMSPQLGQALKGEKTDFYVRSAALVTNMAVHIKSSPEGVLVWVTQLSDTKPVAGAQVQVMNNKGKPLASGRTDARGLATIKGRFGDDGEFYVVAEKGNDFSFTRSTWSNGIESWRFQLSQGQRVGPHIGHAILDRSLLRPEETLSAKIVFRDTSKKGLMLPTKKRLASDLILTHDSGAQTFKVPLRWNLKNGTADIQWRIPQGARLGRWLMSLEKSDADGYALDIGDFRVEYFRIPLMKAQINSVEKNLVQETKPAFNVGAEFLAGGAASKLPLSLRWSVEPFYLDIQNDEYQDFQWMNGKVKEGLYRSGDESFQSHIPQSGKQDLTLDQQGGAQVQIKNLKYAVSPQRLRTEIEFKDPNGEIQNVGRSFTMWPADRLVGIRSKSWWAKKDRVDFDVAVLSLSQEPVAGAEVKVELFVSRYLSHRKRLVGGFYSYESFQEIKKVGDLCKGKTNAKGIFECVGKSHYAGSVVAVVSVKDSKGRMALAQTQQWIVGDQVEQWFGSQDNDRADLVAFKKFYEPGEKAQFQLRTPFKTSKVLLTIEREGIIDSKIVDVNSENPTFEVPIKAEYAPNVVVSAFAVRGRLDGPRATALVDLAKPAFKMGMSEIKVGWAPHRLKVKVSTDRKTYKSRDKARVKINVTDSQGRAVKNGEVVLAAVDEGLLELRNNTSWDILPAMMALHPHLVSTATAQTFVIGKRHFGLKALPIGGDGRGGSLRELFDTLLYWNPSVKLNARGEAEVEVPLNDSLSSFRIVAVALRGADQFGTGWTSIQSTRDLMIFAGLPTTIRQGDELGVEYTLRNTSSQIQDLTVSLTTTPASSSFETQKLRLNPQESRTVSWKVKAPEGISKLDYLIQAKNSSGLVLDQMKKTQEILPVIRPAIYQSQMGQWPDFKSISVTEPAGALKGQTSLVLDVSSSLVGNATGIKDFWKSYPYSCLEQQVSKSVSTQDKKLWEKIDGKWSLYLDSKGLLKFFPESSYGSTSLTAYVLSLAHEAGWSIQEDSEQRMLSALSAFVDARLRSDEPSRGDEEIRKISAMEALSRYRHFTATSASHLALQLDQWPLYSLVEWYQILRWEKDIPQREQKLRQVDGVLRSRMYFSSKRLKFKDEGRDQMPWLMRDSDVAALRLVLSTMDDASWSKDSPRMVLGALDRQVKGAWSLTTSNAWGTLMLKKYSDTFEKVKPQGVFSWDMGSSKKSHSWKDGNDKAFDIPLETNSANLNWKQEGKGKPWVTVSVKSAVPLTKPLVAGYAIEKTLIPVEQKKSGVWSRGDVVKVQVKLQAQAPMSWVVLNDPIPSGATVLGSGLGRDSEMLTQKTTNDLWSDSVERAQDSVRFYYSWFPQGKFTIEYTLRFNQAGVFLLPQTRVEAMYSPDLFGERPNNKIRVVE
ncbi:hypothetical protein D3C87_110770 [compost metagenome]